MMSQTLTAPSVRAHERGFTLVELLVSMAITTVILGATMAAMNDAIKATDSAMLLTNMNNGLRTSMDVMVRDMLQVGQGLPSGRLITIPNGANSQAVRMPGPPGTAYTLVGATDLSAVMPGPGLGPVVNGAATDMLTTLQADSAFDTIDITQLNATAAVGSMVVSTVLSPLGNGANISNTGPDDIKPGDLIMLTKGSLSVLVQTTRVVGQTVFFDPGDSLNLNQSAAADGTLFEYRTTAPSDVPPNPAVAGWTPPSKATRIRMISYYIDATTSVQRPRLVRRMGNGHPTTFNNLLGTAVAFDVENLQITYDLADSATNPANVKMVAADLAGTGRCSPNPCTRNQIRKVNFLLSTRSRAMMKGSRQFLRNRLQTQVSLRSLAFVDRYQ